MRRIGIGLFAGVLGIMGTVGLAGTASAYEHRGHGHEVRHRVECRVQGRPFRGGFYYSRSEHPVWGRCVWDAHCGRWQYWDPCLSVWYYWCPQDSCYYPITYCP
jgi:hypothetical protein